MITLLTLHIALMALSLVGTFATALAVLIGKQIKRSYMVTNTVATSIGTLCGAALLIENPIGIKCLMLLSYTIVFSAIQLIAQKRNQLFARSELS